MIHFPIPTNIHTMRVAAALGVIFLATGAFGQTPGDAKTNTVLKMPMEICQSEGNCQTGEGLYSCTVPSYLCTLVGTSVSLDANWHWIHDSSSTNCYSGNIWDSVLCPDSATCTANCVLGKDSCSYSSSLGAAFLCRGSRCC